MNDETYYEVEIKKLPLGFGASVYLVEPDGERVMIGEPAAPFSAWPSPDAALKAATAFARRHRDGPGIVRLDLDTEPEEQP